MIITHQRGRGSKIHLLLDGEYKITTDANFWADHYISDGSEISESEWETLVGEINYKKALNKCGDLLSRRDHSVYELRQKLMRTVDEASADRAVERYKEAGYLDDERFCRSLAEYLFGVKKYSENHVRQECFKRGIARDIVNDVLSEFEVDPVSQLCDLIENKYASKLNGDNGRQKVVAALMRKGFHYGDISSALNRIGIDEN